MAPRKRKKPTIEDRLDAVTHTLELLAGMQLTTEASVQNVASELAQLTALSKAMLTIHEARIQKLERKK
jgi:hypothetical protein